MAIGFFTGSGGGVDTSEVTATAEDVLASKVIVDANGNPLTGTMPNNGAISQTLAINGSYNIPQGYHNGSGIVTQNIATMGAQSITPKSSAQTIACNGKYMTGNITVSAINGLKVVTGSVTNTYTSSNMMANTNSATSIGQTAYWQVSLSGFKSIDGVCWYGFASSSNTSSTYGVDGFALKVTATGTATYSNHLKIYTITNIDGTTTQFSCGTYSGVTYQIPVISPTLVRLPMTSWSNSNYKGTGKTIYYTIIGTAA